MRAVEDWTASERATRLLGTRRATSASASRMGETMAEIAEELGLSGWENKFGGSSVPPKTAISAPRAWRRLSPVAAGAPFRRFRSPMPGAMSSSRSTGVSQPMGAGPDSIDGEHAVRACRAGLSGTILLDQLVARLQGSLFRVGQRKCPGNRH